MSKSSEHTPLQGRDTNGKEAHEKMLHTWSQQDTNENHETPAHLSERWNSEIWPHPVLTRTGCNRNSHSLPVGLQDRAATLEDKTPVSYKTKHTLNLPHTSHTPWCLPNGLKTCPHKTHTRKSIAALLIKPQRGSNQETQFECINKLWDKQAMKYYCDCKKSYDITLRRMNL